MKNRKLLNILLLTILVLLLSSTTSVLADSNVKMTIEPGFDGYFKSDETTLIRVTITNNSDKDIQGMVYMPITGDEGSKYYQNVTVAKNTTKEVNLIVSQSERMYLTNYVYFEANGEELAKEQIKGVSLQSYNSLLVGILANDLNTGNFLTINRPGNQNIYTAVLTEKDIPTNSIILNSLDMLVINDYSLDKFNSDQINTIKEWINNGGTLIIGGGANSQKNNAPLADILPVNINGYVKIDSLSSLEEITGSTLKIDNNLIISNAEVKDGETLYSQDNIPIFALGKVNSGQVLYVAYDMADEVLSNWVGNHKLWEQIFSKLDLISNRNNFKNNSYINNALLSAEKKIPSINLPNISVLIVMFAIYIIVLIPLLYFILKRKDKREWAWLFIPVLAIMLTVGIFAYGSNTRGNKIMTHNVSLLELESNGYGKIKTASGVFVQSSNDYKLQFEGIDFVAPSYDNNFGSNYGSTLISMNKDKADIILENIEFWGHRAVSVEKTLTDIGQITTDLKFNGKGITGTITNNTNIDIHDIKLIYDEFVYEIGDFKVGESIDVNVADIFTVDPNKIQNIDEGLLPANIPLQNRYSTRESDLARIIQDRIYSRTIVTPYIVGWSEDDVIYPEIAGVEQLNESLTIISKEVKISPNDDGIIYFLNGTFEASMILEDEGIDVINSRPKGSWFEIAPNSDSKLSFIIRDPDIEFEVSEVKIHENSNGGVNIKVYNWETEEYNSFEDAFNNYVLSGENVNKYISVDGELRVEYANDSSDYSQFEVPSISVIGKVEK